MMLLDILRAHEKACLTSKLHALADTLVRPVRLFLTAKSLCVGARALLGAHGYDADWFREAMVKQATTPCIPSRKRRKVALLHDPALDIG